MTTYPFSALLDRLGNPTVGPGSRTLGISGESFKRYQANGLTAEQADRLAVRAGFHPLEVWPDWELDEFAGRHGRKWTYSCGCRCDACVEANRTSGRNHYEKNREARREQMRAYYEAASEYERKRRRERYWKDPEAARAARREHYERTKA